MGITLAVYGVGAVSTLLFVGVLGKGGVSISDALLGAVAWPIVVPLWLVVVVGRWFDGVVRNRGRLWQTERSDSKPQGGILRLLGRPWAWLVSEPQRAEGRGGMMNRRQKVVVVIGVFLVIASGLFPPYEGEVRRSGDNLKGFVGYGFLFSPPSQQDVSKALGGPEFLCSSQIETQRVWLQLATVIVATLGLVVLLADRPRKGSRVQDSADAEVLSETLNEVEPRRARGDKHT